MMRPRTSIVVSAPLSIALTLALGTGCSQEPPPAPPAPPAPAAAAAAAPAASPAEALLARAKGLFATLPAQVDNPDNPITDAKVALGRVLYADTRLSKNHDLSCNSCHALDKFGVDVRPESGATSAGHKAQKGDRNTPTVYNAALHFTQFWDGRAKDVEEQAKGPILNPVEMAVLDAEHAVAMLTSIPGYEPLFKAAFPGETGPISYDNVGKAIGAFERKLTTPDAFDAFLGGKTDALDERAQRGLALFLDAGCVACHMGPALGGQMYQKLGLLKPYETKDVGRFGVTKNEADKFFFKVPSLRNVAKTAPYFHDGSVVSLTDAIRIMARVQTAKGEMTDAEVADMLAFFDALTGTPPADLIAPPTLPESGPTTPKPDPG
jgi:cytochrome c peroxidase